MEYDKITICESRPADIMIESRKGRFREEVNYVVYTTLNGYRWDIAVIKVFYGRPPYYRRWAEIFAINKEFTSSSGETTRFKDSRYEEFILDCVSSLLGPGESIFIETIYDEETERLIEKGIPVPLTRLGYKLLERGFTWFKAWYFPEGFMEGSTKIQASKPLNQAQAEKDLSNICNEVRAYSKSHVGEIGSSIHSYEREALERAISILSKYCSP